jgi:hypothetical protein
MKIGSFAKEFDVSIDTVRYYIDVGLLTPQKDGKNYIFSVRDVDDMKLICTFRNYKFSMSYNSSFGHYMAHDYFLVDRQALSAPYASCCTFSRRCYSKSVLLRVPLLDYFQELRNFLAMRGTLRRT